MIKLKKVNYYLMEILLFFALFDSARNYTVLPSFFGYIKDICVYALLLLNIEKIKFPLYLGKSFYIWMIIIIVFTPLGFLFCPTVFRSTVLIYCFKFPEIFILFLIFFNWKNIISVPLEKFIYQYVYGALLLCFVNIFGYYVKNPFISIYIGKFAGRELYRGRITVGQPAVAIFPVILAFVFLVFFAHKVKDYFLLMIYLICIIIATSNTGIVSIFSVIIITFFSFLIQRKKVSLKTIFTTGGIIIVMGGFLIYAYNYIEAFHSIVALYSEKILSYLHSGNDLSMNVRKNNWNNALNSISGFNKIIGRGAMGYIATAKSTTLVENTYILTYVMYGVLGIVSMMIFFIQQLFKSIKNVMKRNKESLFLLCIIIVYLLHFYTLDLYLLFMLYFPLAMFFGYVSYKIKSI